MLLRRLALRLADVRRDFHRELRRFGELCRDFRMFGDARFGEAGLPSAGFALRVF
jgi:hypothetical protein